MWKTILMISIVVLQATIEVMTAVEDQRKTH